MNRKRELEVEKAKVGERDLLIQQLQNLKTEQIDKTLELRTGIEERDREIALLRESKDFFKKKVKEVEGQRNQLDRKVQNEDELLGIIREMEAEAMEKKEDFEQLSSKLYEIEVKEQLFLKEKESIRNKVREMETSLQRKDAEILEVETNFELENVQRPRIGARGPARRKR